MPWTIALIKIIKKSIFLKVRGKRASITIKSNKCLHIEGNAGPLITN